MRESNPTAIYVSPYYYICVTLLCTGSLVGDIRGSKLDTREREGERERERERGRERESSESRAASKTALFAPMLLMCPHTTNAYRKPCWAI